MHRALLSCGLFSSLLWVATDIVASVLYDGYSYRSQTISELSALGAPTRYLVLPLVFAWDFLVIAFGISVWISAYTRRALRIAAALLILAAIINLAIGPFSSMHTREVLAAGGGTLSDTLHIVVAMQNIVFFLLIMGSGAVTFGKRFRRYSIATIIVFMVFGAWTALYAPRVQANLPTPWMGLAERVSAYSFMLWIAVLSAALLVKRKTLSVNMRLDPTAYKSIRA